MLFLPSRKGKTVDVAQLVRALDCGSRGRRFEPGLPPEKLKASILEAFFILLTRVFFPIFFFVDILSKIFQNRIHILRC